ncbi:pilus assembly protein TadG-related protein [Sphingopyxis panaciterrae]
MGGTIFSRLRLGAKRLLRDQRGNAMFLTAAAIVPVIGIVGSGVDIGRAYMTQLRLQQACDAGVLAGRRAMAAGTYSTAAQGEANKMFNFNMPTGIYGSKNIAFASQAPNTADVTGTASAKLPTALMYIFGTKEFNLSVACTAKLEISNVDVMMVLDVTGSMSRANGSDTVTKIAGLRKASIDFFDTLTNADIGDGQLRFGVVPYSSTVNVGQILLAKNRDWMADEVTLPSRTPNFKITYGNASSEISDTYNDGTTVAGTWSSGSNVNKSFCNNGTSPPPDTTPTTSGTPTRNQTAQFLDGDGDRITTYDRNQKYTYYSYRYTTSGNNCKLQQRTMTFTRTFTETVTEEQIKTFQNYTYQNRSFDVTGLKLGQQLVTNTGTNGADVTISWNGCIIERATDPFGPTASAPDDALDMDITLVPNASNEDTQWQMFLSEVSFGRSSANNSTSTTNSSSFAVRSQTTDYGACPVAAMPLTKMTKADKSKFETYINSLQPKGYTYHDAGMAWGARLLSPVGLFASENATATNNRPISRHIVFMTDGEMTAPRDNLSHQGNEITMQRIGATSDDNAVARHNNRFVQLCQRARDQGITIWVVSFGVGSNTQLNSCATSGEAYESDDSAELNANFQSIARQISKLRLSK